MSSSAHRLDIQGLRALAVLLVVVFHFTPKLMPGGYIGVDVFFVISGFLITGHLVREASRTGGIRLGAFWAKRVRRLLPAAFLVLAVSALMILLFFSAPKQIQSLTEITFAALYVLNWRLAADSVDYLGSQNSPSIAQHYWSLSVEEQFYIVWPLLILLALWIAMKVGRANVKQAVTVLLVIVFVASLAYSIYETSRSQPSAYFITTTRAWEFAAGGLIAMMPLAQLKRGIHALLSWVALFAIVGAAVLFGSETQFPGWIALIPVLATALLIWVGDSDAKFSPQALTHNRPIQLTGDMSYSIYLWHWPVFIVLVVGFGVPPIIRWAPLLLVVTLVLAVLTKYFVEDPVRKAPGLLKKRSVTFGAMVASMAVVCAVTVVPVQAMERDVAQFNAAVSIAVEDTAGCFGAYAIMNGCSNPYEVTATVNPLAAQFDLAGDWLTGSEHCEQNVVVEWPENSCEVFSDETDSGLTVLLIGDSHGSHIVAPLQTATEQLGWNLRVRTRPGCTAFDQKNERSERSSNVERCMEWNRQNIDDAIADPDIDIILFSNRTSLFEDPGDNAVDVIHRLQAAGKQVVIVREVPGLPNSVIAPECVADSDATTDPCAWYEAERDDWAINAAAQTDAHVFDTWEVLCSADGTCHTVVGGTIVYNDSNHLTLSFTRSLSVWLQQQLVQVAELRG